MDRVHYFYFLIKEGRERREKWYIMIYSPDFIQYSSKAHPKKGLSVPISKIHKRLSPVKWIVLLMSYFPPGEASPPLNDDTKISTETDTETFFPKPNFPKPKPRLFLCQILRNWNRDFFPRPNFSETETFFWDQIVQNRKPQKFGKSLKTEN